jgi:RNA polymerase sigma-70 factor (ECF subfamily)
VPGSSLAAPARPVSAAPPPALPRPSRADRRVAARLRDGDPRGLEELYERHGGAVFAVLVRTVRDRAAAEDVQQQVFTEAWRRGPEYDPERAGLLTWLLTIARSRAIDHLRRRVPEPQDPASAGAAAEAASPDGVDDLVDRWRLTALVQELPPEERALLALRFHGGLSQSEIAERTGIPLGTVKTRMVRGLERLRAALEAEGGR